MVNIMTSLLPDADNVTVSDGDDVLSTATDGAIVDDDQLQRPIYSIN